MWRDNLFRSINAGGLGLTHLFVSQFVSRFLFLRAECHRVRRSVAQSKLATHLPYFLVSPHVNELPMTFGFWREVVDSFQFLGARFSMDCYVSRRRLLKDLREILFPVPLSRSLLWTWTGHFVPGEEGMHATVYKDVSLKTPFRDPSYEDVNGAEEYCRSLGHQFFIM